MTKNSKLYFAGGTSQDRTKQEWLELMVENGVRQLTVYETKDHVMGEDISVKMEAAEEFEVLEFESVSVCEDTDRGGDLSLTDK